MFFMALMVNKEAIIGESLAVFTSIPCVHFYQVNTWTSRHDYFFLFKTRVFLFWPFSKEFYTAFLRYKTLHTVINSENLVTVERFSESIFNHILLLEGERNKPKITFPHQKDVGWFCCEMAESIFSP